MKKTLASLLIFGAATFGPFIYDGRKMQLSPKEQEVAFAYQEMARIDSALNKRMKIENISQGLIDDTNRLKDRREELENEYGPLPNPYTSIDNPVGNVISGLGIVGLLLTYVSYTRRRKSE